MCPWLDALPEVVRLPFLHFSEEDLASCRDGFVVQEARAMAASARATYEVLLQSSNPMLRMGALAQTAKTGQRPCS